MSSDAFEGPRGEIPKCWGRVGVPRGSMGPYKTPAPCLSLGPTAELSIMLISSLLVLSPSSLCATLTPCSLCVRGHPPW